MILTSISAITLTDMRVKGDSKWRDELLVTGSL